MNSVKYIYQRLRAEHGHPIFDRAMNYVRSPHLTSPHLTESSRNCANSFFFRHFEPVITAVFPRAKADTNAPAKCRFFQPFLPTLFRTTLYRGGTRAFF
ncbi:MAG: hypothetical protein LBH00_06080, partial [Planctomycetaceae bacterium]|nr:hypothetical protein [Planctomycetaceae bacterium]